MSAVSPIRTTLISNHVTGARAVPAQDIEIAGFRSLVAKSAASVEQPPCAISTAASANSTASHSDDAAYVAWQEAAETERLQWKQWSETSLQRSSADLLPRMTRDDASALQALVDRGTMTWAEINTALTAKIKSATSQELDRQKAQLGRTPASWRQVDEAWEAQKAWGRAMMDGEAEIRARFEEKSAGLFAEDPGTGPAALEKLVAQQQVMDGLWNRANAERAVLARKMGPEPRPAVVGRVAPFQYALAKAQHTPEETEAMNKLDAAGFADLTGLMAVIGILAREVADNVDTALDRTFPAAVP